MRNWKQRFYETWQIAALSSENKPGDMTETQNNYWASLLHNIVIWQCLEDNFFAAYNSALTGFLTQKDENFNIMREIFDS